MRKKILTYVNLGVLCLCTLVIFIFNVQVSSAAGIVVGNDIATFPTPGNGDLYFTTTLGDPVDITETTMIGEAWGDVAGWISFSGSNYAVTNTCSAGVGTLSGYGWGSTAGWVNFGPHGSGTDQIEIDTDGYLDGYTWSQNFGWIEFDSSTCPGGNGCVQTTNECPADSGGPSSGGGSSGSRPVDSVSPTAPRDPDLPSNIMTCSVAFNPSSTRAGESTLLIWQGRNGVTGNVNNIWPMPGNGTASRKIAPTTTTTFTGTIINTDGESETCSATLAVRQQYLFTFPGFQNPGEAVLGCTDVSASNYSPSATENDGSCIYTGLENEPDTLVDRNNPLISINPLTGEPECSGRNCPREYFGCTDPSALNHDSLALIDDGSCRYTEDPLCVGLACLVSPIDTITFDNAISLGEYIAATINAFGNSRGGVGASGVGVLASIAGMIVTLTAGVSSFSQLLLRIGSFGLSIFVPLGKRPWGVVFDSITKQPIDPAYISVRDETGEEISSAITDINGRFGFMLNPGTYTIFAGKTNYTFPSKKLNGQKATGIYQDLYFGESFTINPQDDIVTKNIPMDAVGVDWNELQKTERGLVTMKYKAHAYLEKAEKVLFPIGFLFTIINILEAQTAFNIFILALYIVTFVLRKKGLKPKSYGRVLQNNEPLAYAAIKAFSSATDVEVAHATTDIYGRYYMLVPAGDYYVTVDKQKSDGSHEEIMRSENIFARRGVIRKIFSL